MFSNYKCFELPKMNECSVKRDHRQREIESSNIFQPSFLRVYFSFPGGIYVCLFRKICHPLRSFHDPQFVNLLLKSSQSNSIPSDPNNIKFGWPETAKGPKFEGQMHKNQAKNIKFNPVLGGSSQLVSG